ncbi:MAG TPA: hypothetical protein VKB70_06960, partial [Gaiellaceae bacterium]|nr:hypothetical protein [Gaiellaceae bacterium]
MTGFISPRVSAYAAIAASGLVAGLALGRVEPVALAAPFLLALVAAVARREPSVSIRLTLDRERALEGDEITARLELSPAHSVDRFDLLLHLPPELAVDGGTARSLHLRGGETRTLELKLHCERWGAFSVGPV